MPDSPLHKLNSKKKQLLTDGCDFLNIKINESQIDQLLKYSVLLGRWSQAYNLTAIKDPFDVIRLHLLDSLAINKFLEGDNFIDVGTGAGLPGIPLAIINPNRKFTLLDSNGKKTRFLFQAKLDLGLANINEINKRVENFFPQEKFDCVITRAFSSLTDMITNCHHLLGLEGYFLAMKGRIDQSELSEVTKNYKVVDRSSINVPGVDGCRNILKIKKS
jgi:16S rRNA (guanine527-N7)-methyltransferase